MSRINIAKIISIAASIFGVVSFCAVLSGGETPAYANVGVILVPVLSLVSYVLCGFFKALSTPFSFAKWGFIVAPFPANLVVVLIMFLFGLLSVVYIPAIPVFRRAAELGA